MTAAGKLVFTIFAALAEFGRALIVERTKTSIAAARARGPKRRHTFQDDGGEATARAGDNGQAGNEDRPFLLASSASSASKLSTAASVRTKPYASTAASCSASGM